jgi:hypothetical protein
MKGNFTLIHCCSVSLHCYADTERRVFCILWSGSEFDYWLTNIISNTVHKYVHKLSPYKSFHMPDSSSSLISQTKRYILWHVDMLLGDDHEIGNGTVVVAWQQPTNNHRGMVYSVWLLSNNWTATEERCFLCDPCRGINSRPIGATS